MNRRLFLASLVATAGGVFVPEAVSQCRFELFETGYTTSALPIWGHQCAGIVPTIKLKWLGRGGVTVGDWVGKLPRRGG